MPPGSWTAASTAISSETAPASAGGRAPETAAERLLAGIWAELLGVELGAEDGFLALGGSSVTAMQMLARLRHQAGVALSLRELLQARTLAELALAVERAPAAEDRDTGPLPAPTTGPQPASFAQERIWFLAQLHPQSALYNVPGAARLTGALDIDALQRSLDRLVVRHPALRTHFAADGELLQVVAPAAPVPLRLDDLSHLPAAAREQRARELAEEEARLPFDLARGPLLRLRLLRLDAGEHVMLLTLHHVAIDGWSLRVLMEELGLLYAGLRSGQPVRLPDLPLTYADVARWQRERLATGGMQRQLDYWRRRLGGDATVLELPGNRSLPQDGQEGVRHELTVEAGLTARLRAFAQAGGFTLFMLLLAAFSVVLRERTGRARVRVGGDVAGRGHPQLERLVGFFVNQVVLQVDLDDAAPARALLEQCRTVVIEAALHQDLPFNSLVEALRPPRREGRSPFFGIKLLYQEGATRCRAWRALPSSPMPPARQGPSSTSWRASPMRRARSGRASSPRAICSSPPRSPPCSRRPGPCSQRWSRCPTPRCARWSTARQPIGRRRGPSPSCRSFAKPPAPARPSCRRPECRDHRSRS